MINVAVLGYGTIGSGVVEIINRNNAVVSENARDSIRVKYVLDLREFEGDPVQEILVHDFGMIVNDEEVGIVVETMGGVHPAFEFVKQALEAGKNVCTSNKELVAACGHELMTAAKANNVNFLFEASCGGGIPIIRALYNSLTGDVIEEITGIMNGTTNYILTKMDTEGASFDEVLKEAQDKGYAERNPEADIEGYDPCRKIAILSSVAYGRQMDYNDIYTEGITKITADDFKYARKLGTKIKLFGTSRNTKAGISALVAPYMVNAKDPLYAVDDVFNAIFVKGNMLGDAMFYGSGAGKLPTASAVVGDVVDMARHPHETVNKIWSAEKIELISHEKTENSFFVRVSGSVSDMKDKVNGLFGDVKIIDGVIEGEFAFFTDVMTEGEFAAKAEKLPGIITRIRTRA
jgi:homoserine dehydrogenase